MNKLRDIGWAVNEATKGNRIARQGWNGTGMFVFMQVPAEIPIEVIPKMQSLPEPVRVEFMLRSRSIRYMNQFALVKEDNTIHGWAPSAADALATDWVILD